MQIDHLDIDVQVPQGLDDFREALQVMRCAACIYAYGDIALMLNGSVYYALNKFGQ